MRSNEFGSSARTVCKQISRSPIHHTADPASRTSTGSSAGSRFRRVDDRVHHFTLFQFGQIRGPFLQGLPFFRPISVAVVMLVLHTT